MINAEKMNENVRQEKTEILSTIGLPELTPYLADNPWTLDVDHIVLGLDGKAIVCRNRWARHIAGVLTGILDKKIGVVTKSAGGRKITYFTAFPTLTVPERHSFQTMTRYFDSHYPGFQVDEEYATFPKALAAYGAPAEYELESDAYEAAEVLADIAGMPSDVITTPNGFAVVLHDRRGDLTEYNCAAIVGACEVLARFSCTRKSKQCANVTIEESYSEDWQKRAGTIYSQQQRIEDLMGRILVHLEDAAGDTPNGQGIDALIPSTAKSSRKSARRRSA